MPSKKNSASRKPSAATGKSSQNPARTKATKENIAESNGAPSQLKITIRPPSGLKEAGPAQKPSRSTKVSSAPSRVQPSRTNKANKMAEILNEMEVDDDATTSLPGRRKRRIELEDEPEQFSTVPDDVGRNPMAPPVKRRKQDASVQPLDIPSQISLQPALPEQIPPSRSLQQSLPEQIPPSRSSQPQTQPLYRSALPEQIPPSRHFQPQTQPLYRSALPEQIPPSRHSQPQTQPPDVRPQLQRQYEAQPAQPQSLLFQGSEAQTRSTQHSNSQTQRQIQTLADNETRYNQPEQEVQLQSPFIRIREDRLTSNSHQPSPFQTGDDQAHSPRNDTAIRIDKPGMRAASDQPQMDRGEIDGRYDDETGDQHQEENDWPVDNMYESPRRSNYHPQLSQSPHIRPEDIDDESPSEEDEAAQRALRSPSPDEIRWEGVADVLQEHRARNRANKPPKDQDLLDAVERQVAGTVSDDEDGGEDGGDDDEDSDPKKNSDANPKALKFYSSSGVWVTAITKSKEVFRRFTMLYNLFPLRDSHLQDAAEILSKVIADLKEEDPTLIFDRQYIQNRDMNIVVFKEAATYRGKMKDFCRKMFRQHYSDALGLNIDIPGQAAHEDFVADNIKELIGRSSKFHFGPEDAAGKKTNFAHPCIRALCIEFYYGSAGGKAPLAKLFAEDFTTSIPEHAVAVAMTCIYNCLDEYRSGYCSKAEFSAENYSDAYETIQHLISLVNNSPVHKRKWDQTRRQWAEQGMMLLNPKSGSKRCNLTVDLD